MMSKYNTDTLFDVNQPDPLQGGRVVRISFDSGADAVFDYLLPDKLGGIQIGQRVEVPFGRKNKLKKGFCVGIEGAKGTESRGRGFKLKVVKRIIDDKPLLDSALMELAEWISTYYVCPLGQVLSAMVPAAVKKGLGIKSKILVYLTNRQDCQSQFTSNKQKEIFDILCQAEAFDAESGVEKLRLLGQAKCTVAPLKTLASKDIVRVARQEVLKFLPVVPEAFRPAEKKVVLNAEQAEAVSKITDAVAAGEFGVTLLYGVTDSGKTEVYIRAIEAVIARGKTAIVMLPEIALTAQTAQRFSSRFSRIAVMHSALTAAQRNGQWQKIRAGRADVVIGARSAVFAPLTNLGLVVVDEEHEASYKQDTVPRYHGRDVAIKRAQLAGAHCVLGSATPSLETLANCRTKGHYSMVRLGRRVMDLPMPQMKLVDMSRAVTPAGPKEIGLISPQLQQRLKEVLARGEQAILLLNRRGYSNFIFCPSCRHTLSCRNCDVTLTFHKRARRLDNKQTVLDSHMSGGYAICHHCLAKTLVPRRCPLCEKRMTMIGLGSQRLEEELAQKVSSAKICRVDSDSMQGADSRRYYEVLGDFAAGRIDILAGTQMLAKGLHFPNVTLVGIISADTSLYLPDFRANERTFQLISQVAGRAGRSAKGGVVIVQSFLPSQPAIRFAIGYDYEGFVKAELEHRKKCNLPPYGRMAIVGMRDVKFDRLNAACEAMRQRLDEIVEQRQLEVRIRGPMPAVISRIQQYHRMQIIVQSDSVKPIQALFSCLRASAGIRPAVKVSIDIDPINLM